MDQCGNIAELSGVLDKIAMASSRYQKQRGKHMYKWRTDLQASVQVKERQVDEEHKPNTAEKQEHSHSRMNHKLQFNNLIDAFGSVKGIAVVKFQVR
jgi:transcriptional regulator with GAF, ATPase, and Fis domain